MPRALKQGDEPVRGYRLVKYLGKGTFGDVWQASGPGGTEVAFKIIRLDNKPHLKSLHGIELIKKIRHPNLVPILAMWMQNPGGVVQSAEDQHQPAPRDTTQTIGEFSLDAVEETRPEALYLAMGLGEKSLSERFKECAAQGQSGIPTAELIGYFEDAARAIDHLNTAKHDLGKGPVAIPHCNLKPQNIIIVGGAAQVSDFGLAHILNEGRGPAQSDVAVGFIAPELLESGQPSLYSDQYSLAVTYHYLRTGAMPFSMNEANVVLTEALEGRLDLSRLTTAEQQVIRRATSRRPEARFANCQDLTRELRRAIERLGTVQNDGLVIEPNREIVPGHKLVSLIGRGAYGEVWEAQAPGRLPIALKIIKDLDRASGRGRQEFRALEIIQSISHNALMELRAYWLLDRHGQPIPDELRGHPGSPVPATLVIATRLADRNLTQVMEKYREEGQPGIPVDELLGYIKDVASALDYLNQPKHKLGNRLVSIQHRDVKPDNIMIANGTIKLTDFGLAKVLETENIVAEIRQDSVGFTFHYAAPEVLRGKVTRWSDQYSLAITYYQLRTGKLPYGQECSAYDQMMRQLEGELDLSSLPSAERTVVAQATSVLPEERYPSCQSFIEALCKAVPSSSDLMTSRSSPDLAEAENAGVKAQHTAAAARRKNPPSGLTPVDLPAMKKDQPTMPVMLKEGEVYPSAIRTPRGSEIDTDLDTPPVTRVMSTPSKANVRITPKKSSTFKQRYLPLVMVFIVGISMAVVVHLFIIRRTPKDVAIATSTQPESTQPEKTPVKTSPEGVVATKPETETKKDPDPNKTKSGVEKGNSNKPMPTDNGKVIVPTKPIEKKDPPPPVIITVLEKNVEDKDFGIFLQSRLDDMIKTNDQPIAFSKSFRDLEKVPASAITAKLLAFRAECMLEGETKDLPKAEEFIKKASDRNTPDAYTHYVEARLWHELREPQRALTALEESLKRDISLSGFRRERALAILEDAAQRVNIVTNAQTLTAQLADPQPNWLATAERFLGKADAGSTLAMILAVQQPAPKDPAPLQAILTEARINEWNNKPQGPVLITALRLKQAESATQANQPATALSLYCKCWDYLIKHREAFDATSPLTLHARILAPAQKVAGDVKPSPERNTQLASILAAYAGLIFESPYEAWPRPANQPALRLAADAYGEAAKLYPGTGRTKAEYLTGQGKCLNRLGSADPADIAAITTNAKAATTEDPTFAGGWNILGLARYYRLAQETSEADVRKTLGESVDAYDKAILLAKQVNPADRELAQYFSNRSLARSMMGDFTPVENNERRNVYQKAIDDALAATQIDANYELSWEALGQSRERLADFLKGAPANSIFSDAVTAYGKLLDARPSLPKGHTYLGRCYIRWGLSDNKDAAKLEKGRDELNKAIKLDKDMAEAHYWLGRYYLAKNDTSPAIESFIQASKHRELGLNHLTNTMNLLTAQPEVLMTFLNQYLPENLAQADARQANALLVRSRLLRDSVKGNPKTPWAEAQPALDRSITDAQNALRLIPSTQSKQRAEAQEAIAATRLKLYNFAEDAAIQTQYRTAMMDDIRSLLKIEQPTQNSWLLAKLLANFLEQDAVNASSEDQGKKLREEAIKALDIALVQAPQSEKEQLRRMKSDIQRKLQ